MHRLSIFAELQLEKITELELDLRLAKWLNSNSYLNLSKNRPSLQPSFLLTIVFSNHKFKKYLNRDLVIANTFSNQIAFNYKKRISYKIETRMHEAAVQDEI